MKSVLIAGSGNFGCWWAASLSLDPSITSITLLDPYKNNTHLAINRAALLSSKKVSDLFDHIDSAYDASAFYDLIVIATNSSERFEVFNTLRQLTTSTCWVLEKVLSSSANELRNFARLQSHSPVLVSHNRRMQPLWKLFKENATVKTPSRIIQCLGPWDLASNLFHFVDLISWLYSTNLKSISISESIWRASEKRANGYFDFNANVQLTYTNGIIHYVTRDSSLDDNVYEFIYENERSSDNLSEISGLWRSNNEIKATLPLMDWSQLAWVFSSSLWNGELLLPSLDEVIGNSQMVLTALRNNWFETSGHSPDIFRIS